MSYKDPSTSLRRMEVLIGHLTDKLCEGDPSLEAKKESLKNMFTIVANEIIFASRKQTYQIIEDEYLIKNPKGKK